MGTAGNPVWWARPHKRSNKDVDISIFLFYIIFMETTHIIDDWEILKRFLPDGWESKAIELNALARRRKIKSAEILLRVLLIYLASGKSLRTTSTYAMESGICDINDVALLHRLKASAEWLRWLSRGLFQSLKGSQLPNELFRKFRVRLVDGTSISEPGSTGTDWRIHYCFQLNTLHCDSFKITSPKIVESFERYDVAKDDLLIGDRGYCKRKAIMHVLNNNGQVLVRFHSTNLPLFKRNGDPWSILNDLNTLNYGDVGDWDIWFKNPATDELVKGRICSIRKSSEATEKAIKKLRRMSSKKGKKLQPETIEHAKYVTLFTTVNRHNLSGQQILELYRGRWQIELVFKRLKGIIGVGHLPKHNPESCIAWLYGKMVVALLVERLYQEANFFSPWGYPT